MRDAELIGDLSLRQTFEKMQDEGLVHLARDDDFFSRRRWGFRLCKGHVRQPYACEGNGR